MVKETMDKLIVEAQAKVEELQTLNAEIEVEKQAAYDEGFTAGAASVGSDVIYTEAELQEKLAAVKAEGDAKVAELEAQVAAVPEQVEAAKAAVKSELAAKYAELQVAESQAETGFAELLK